MADQIVSWGGFNSKGTSGMGVTGSLSVTSSNLPLVATSNIGSKVFVAKYSSNLSGYQYTPNLLVLTSSYNAGWDAYLPLVGIGLENPTYNLDVFQGGPFSAVINLESAYAQDSYYRVKSYYGTVTLDNQGTLTSTGANGGGGNFYANVSNAVNLKSILYVTGSSVGIGTTSQTARVTVKGTGTTSSTTSLLVQDSSANTTFSVKDDGSIFFGTGSITYGPTSGPGAGLKISLVTGWATAYPVSIGNLNTLDGYVVGGVNQGAGGGYVLGNNNTVNSGTGYILGNNNTQNTYNGTHIMIGFGHTSDAPTNTQNASIVIGQQNNTNGYYGGGLIGSGLKYYDYGQLAFGGNSGNVNFAISQVYFGNGVRNENAGVDSNNGHGPNISINTSQAYSGSAALNRNGGSLSLRGGQGTGTGSAGDVIFATATTGSDGATYHSYSNRVWVKGHTGFVGIGTSSPSASLHVTGSTLITGSLTFNGSDLSTAWTSYTPTWTSDGTAPSLGDGTLTGAYKVVGKTCFVRVRLIWGTTTTSGTGVFYFDLPVSASTSWGIQMPVSMLDNGNAWYQATANGEYGGFTNKVALIGQSAGGANSSQGVAYNFPFTFANLDSIQFNGSYEIA